MTDTLHDLRHNFLTWLDAWHASEGYEADYTILAHRLDLNIKEATRSKYDGHTRTIYIARGLHAHRERHEGLHEVTHHLFQHGEDGAFKAAAQRLAPSRRDSRKGVEEGIVWEASWRLLIPQRDLEAICDKSEFDVEAAVQLAKECRTSFEFAGRRVVDSLTRPVRGIVLDTRGWVVANFSNNVGIAKYGTGRDFFIPDTHPLRHLSATGRVVELRAAIPFKRSRRYWPVPVEAWADAGRYQTLALFDGRRSKNRGMRPLWPNLYMRKDS